MRAQRNNVEILHATQESMKTENLSCVERCEALKQKEKDAKVKTMIMGLHKQNANMKI